MKELDADRELREAVTMLKAAEYKIVENENLSKIEDIFAIHFAVLQGRCNTSEALEFIESVYMKDDNIE